MKLTITPAKLQGTITPPPSKSHAHRLLIAAGLSGGRSTVRNVSQSKDIQATLSCLSAMGAFPEEQGDSVLLHGLGNSIPQYRDGHLPVFNCCESGSTLRFMIPIALAVIGGGVFTGQGRLMERPQQPYFDIFKEKGIFYEQKDGKLTIVGELTPGTYTLPGNVSSQFVTGLLFALPLLEGDSEIVLTTELESRGYVDITRDAMKQYGVEVKLTKNGFLIPGNQRYRSADTVVEADWSQAAFWYAAKTVGNDVTVTGMRSQSLHLDRLVVDYSEMIAGEPWKGGVSVPIYAVRDSEQPARELPVQCRSGRGVGLDVRHVPDLVPPLAAMGALMDGTLHIKNAQRLRIKESDRLATVTATLNALGAQVTEEPAGLRICGQETLAGGVTIDCCNDHRIAMMAAIAATKCREPVTLIGAECVSKSYPNFWEDYKKLGGIICEHTGE